MHSASAGDFYISYHRIGLLLSKAFNRIQARGHFFVLIPVLARQMPICLRKTEGLLADLDLASLDREGSIEVLIKLDSLHRQFRRILDALPRLEKLNRLYFRLFCNSLIGDTESVVEKLDDIIETIAISLDESTCEMLRKAVIEATEEPIANCPTD
jgi:hypothetical protein